MRNIKIFSIIAFVSFAFFGCNKGQENIFSEYTIVDPNLSFFKVNYNVAYYNNPFVQLKINGVRVSGTNIQTRYPFPGGGFNTLGGSTGDYLPIQSGNNEISLSIPKKGTSIDSVEVFKTTISTAAGKKYSLHVADTLVRKSLIVDEEVSLPAEGIVRYRFVNLMPNVAAIDLYIGSIKVVSNIPFMGISDPFTLPITQTNVSTIWAIRAAGTPATSTAIATYNSASTLLGQRVYTVFATGYNGYPTTGSNLDPRRPFVSFYYVR